MLKSVFVISIGLTTSLTSAFLPQHTPQCAYVEVPLFSSTELHMNSGYKTDNEYSRCLTPRNKANVMSENAQIESGNEPLWKRVLAKPYRVMRSKLLPSRVPKPGNLILLCCGESAWRANYTFTGWADPDLTPQGKLECEHAARLLLESGYEPDVIYTSRLKRAIHTSWIVQNELDSAYLPVYKSWRLNERYYGSLQGLCKKKTAEEFGATVVQAWRQGLKARPPMVNLDDPASPRNDRRYSDLDDDQIPKAESLEDCMERTLPLWEYRIKKELARGTNVLVAGHTNSLRGLAKIIDGISSEVIENVTFLPGIPVVYKFDQKMDPIVPSEGSPVQKGTSGIYLEQPGLLDRALKRNQDWKDFVPGARDADYVVKRAKSLERSLLKLKQEKDLEKWAEKLELEENNDQVMEFLNTLGAEEGQKENKSSEDFEEDEQIKRSSAPLTVNPMNQYKIGNDPVVVFVRHGTTPHNQLKLFTGWEDPPLSDEGVEDAKRAGRILRDNGFEFDVVYTSWLSRAIETAWYILDELDMLWLPMVKSWRLNERHYGALTGKSKKMIGNTYGEDQLIKWRRSFDIPPPPVSSYSLSYPGNDPKRIKYVTDLRISLSETINRSFEAKEFQIHRKFPKSESLKQCMARSIPFYTEKIVPEAVAKGKRVLITSHENAIRGILKHLCDIPDDKMNNLHLPNGLPLVYNVRRRCITLLDDGTGRDPMEIHDFGAATEYLFQPCELLDEDFIFEETKEEEVVEEKKQVTTVG